VVPENLHRQFIFGSAYVASHPYAIADAAEDVESVLEMGAGSLQGGPSRWRLPTQWCTAC